MSVAFTGQLLREVIGGRTATAMAKELGLFTVDDLLKHYPRRYTRRGELTAIAGLSVGDHVTLQAQVLRSAIKQNARGGYRLVVEISDGSAAQVDLTFFSKRYPQWLADKLPAGTRGLFSGKVTMFNRRLQLTHPEYQPLDDAPTGVTGELVAMDYALALIPLYPASQHLQSWTIAASVALLLPRLGELVDPLPVRLRRELGLQDLAGALAGIHQPGGDTELDVATERLRFDEAFGLQLVLARRRALAGRTPATARRPRPDGLLAALDQRLPFTRTDGQVRVGEAIKADLAVTRPMHRLLQGEVGSGKTLVALRAMLQVVDAGGQAALLAPTEVLATQHARGLEALLGPLAQAGRLGAAEQATQVVLVTGSMTAAQRRETLLAVASGEAGLVVGTHALLEPTVKWADLGLVVVDEQHRFGVEQRAALTDRAAKVASSPHLLVMTATPIPRTVAMTVYGDLETSQLTELPAGRSAIATTVVPVGQKPAWLDRAWQRVREEVAAGRQAFVVCPRIGDDTGGGAPRTDADEQPVDPDGPEADDRPQAAAVLDVAPALADGPLAGLRVAVLHGRMPAEDKDAVMRAMAAGEVDVLVATTVIEVGVDVPNATVMVVLDADRFGISQLHQLRGRVGRGEHPAVCLLVTGMPAGTSTRQRLDAVARTTDGFELAQADLELRKEGDVLGSSQSGTRSGLRLLRLAEHEQVIVGARAVAERLLATDPDLSEHPLLADWTQRLEAGDSGDWLERG